MHFGTSSISNSNRLASSIVLKVLTPVAFPPGLLKLATRPSLTGSPPVVNTIGIEDVAVFAMTWAPPTATIKLTGRSISSAARSGFCPTELNSHIAIWYEASLLQTLQEGIH
jgi:hypothetical protein